MFRRATWMTLEFWIPIPSSGQDLEFLDFLQKQDMATLSISLAQTSSCLEVGLRTRATVIATSWRRSSASTSKFGQLRKCAGRMVSTSETLQPRDTVTQPPPSDPISWSSEDGNSRRPSTRSLSWGNSIRIEEVQTAYCHNKVKID